jgi:hypothetical protein
VHSYSDPHRIDPDATSVSGIEGAVTWARDHDAAVWVTEWGYRPDAPSEWWGDAVRRFDRAGVGVAVAYELHAPQNAWRWDTGLLNPNGSPRTAWLSLKQAAREISID